MEKLIDTLKKNLVTISMSLLFVCWTCVKDVFVTGAEAKSQKTFNNFLSSKSSRKFIYNLSDSAIHVALKDPAVWLELLSSSHMSSYAKERSKEVRESIYQDLVKKDSMEVDMIHLIGEGTGMRNEDVMPELINLLKAYNRGDFELSRKVRANF
tara:strand:+ start:596 stop:1057 length:462 start_codon:yes stop_codon:yes gene_type:complete